ncbi:MAG: hypothetical protein ACAH17_00275 [Candidatus Paceibacterota bacterium]
MRIFALIGTCKGCPNRKYDSSNVYRCKLVGEIIRNENEVAAFCPLPHYPSSEIASLEATLQSLQKLHDYSFPYAVFSFIANKLKAKISSEGRSIHLLTWDSGKNEDFYIVIDRITKIDYERSKIYFLGTDPGKNYFIQTGYAGADWTLNEVVSAEGESELSTQIAFTVAP